MVLTCHLAINHFHLNLSCEFLILFWSVEIECSQDFFPSTEMKFPESFYPRIFSNKAIPSIWSPSSKKESYDSLSEANYSHRILWDSGSTFGENDVTFRIELLTCPKSDNEYSGLTSFSGFGTILSRNFVTEPFSLRSIRTWINQVDKNKLFRNLVILL